MNAVLGTIKRFIPAPLFRLLAPVYHYLLALIGAVVYGFPSRGLYVIAVTGTKGKSSTTEIINSILEHAGYKTVLINTIRFKVGEESRPNKYKMTLPGRMFVSQTLREATNKKCTHAVIEITSEGIVQFRHAFVDIDALVFTNLSREHIESHGSFEKYAETKLRLRAALVASPKKKKVVVANTDDDYGKKFLDVTGPITKLPYSLKDVTVVRDTPDILFVYNKTEFASPLQGIFNVENILAGVVLARYLGIPEDTVQNGLASLSFIPGRVEHVRLGQSFSVIVDYAHTPDSLEKLYQTFKEKHRICVLGNTGGGRDTWKRPVMGAIAERYCDMVILTDEDPYDENPEAIVKDMTKDMTKKPVIIMDRRKAVAHALLSAHPDSVILITGKGTDPYIMRAHGKKEPWSDKTVVEEELKKIIDAARSI